MWCARLSETFCHIGISLQLGLAHRGFIVQQLSEMCTESRHIHAICHQLGHYFVSGYKVDQRDVGHLEK